MGLGNEQMRSVLRSSTPLRRRHLPYLAPTSQLPVAEVTLRSEETVILFRVWELGI